MSPGLRGVAADACVSLVLIVLIFVLLYLVSR